MSKERSEKQLMRKACLLTAKAIEARANELNQQDSLPGYTRTERESIRAWIMDFAAEHRAIRNSGIIPEE